MKLAEALQERADLKKKIGGLDERLAFNACVQEGEQPAEEPAELLKELEECLLREKKIIAAVNLTNSKTKIGEKTLTELLAEREVLIEKERIYRSFLAEASKLAKRARLSEIKVFSTVNVRELRGTADDISAELRRLNNIIQEANWTVETEF